MLEASVNKECVIFVHIRSPAVPSSCARCDELRTKIKAITDGEYAASKREVDTLRQELGQEALPSLQNMLDEKSASLSISCRTSVIQTEISNSYIRGRRLNANGDNSNFSAKKRPAPAPKLDEGCSAPGEPPVKRPRGRPRGSRNKGKEALQVATGEDDS